MSPALANHLLQSTVFAVAAGLLTLFLRTNHARTRYWIWLAASLKFLIPFSLFIAVVMVFPDGLAGIDLTRSLRKALTWGSGVSRRRRESKAPAPIVPPPAPSAPQTNAGGQ